MPETTIRIENKRDRWRFLCPAGHRSWEPTNYHFWCARCARRLDVDGEFARLRDRKTGELVEREEIELLTPVGPYEHGEGSA